VRSAGEIGAIAYFCGCSMIDPFSDRGLVVRMVHGVESHTSPLKRLLLEADYHFLADARPTRTPLALVEATRVPEDALGAWPISSPWTDPHGGWHYLALVPAGR
jgi:hypothetical protein